MNKVLVDTSVWIDFLNGKHNKSTRILTKLIQDDFRVVLCPTIIQEILQGIREDKSFIEVKDNLTGFEVLALDGVVAAYGASALYREIRKRGATIRKTNDCLIAYYAIYHKVKLLHNDKDFDLIARHSSLRIF